LSSRKETILALLARLQEEGGGLIRWDRFMAAALYDPEVGYYSASIATVGRGGDFSTVPTLDQSLARSVAAWGAAERRKHRHHLPWIEVGPGDGSLTHGILQADGWMRNRFRPCHLVETSPGLQAEQRRKLKGFRVQWNKRLRDALTSCRGRGLIFSNELVDAFPCRIFRRDEQGTWDELFIGHDENGVKESWQPTRDLPESSVFQLDHQAGHRVEVHEAFQDWLQRELAGWKAGSVLTIDYGGSAGKIFHRRPGGTLRAYWRQQRLVGPEVLARFGRQDLTADVNFDDIRKWLECCGARTVWEGSLRDYCRKFDPAGKSSWLDGEGPGDAFRVLWQRKPD